MMNVLLLITVSGVISPTSAPFSTRQYFGIALPPVERLAVEDRLETRLVAVDRLGPIALLRHVRRGRLLERDAGLPPSAEQRDAARDHRSAP